VLLGFTFDLGVKVIYIIPLLDISGLVFPYWN
jgi:hypothetical protein